MNTRHACGALMAQLVRTVRQSAISCYLTSMGLFISAIALTNRAPLLGYVLWVLLGTLMSVQLLIVCWWDRRHIDDFDFGEEAHTIVDLHRLTKGHRPYVDHLFYHWQRADRSERDRIGRGLSRTTLTNTTVSAHTRAIDQLIDIVGQPHLLQAAWVNVTYNWFEHDNDRIINTVDVAADRSTCKWLQHSGALHQLHDLMRRNPALQTTDRVLQSHIETIIEYRPDQRGHDWATLYNNIATENPEQHSNIVAATIEAVWAPTP